MNQTQRNRIYLDHAATSWPKADGVVDAMLAYMRDNGATASRGGYASARHAGALVDRLRRRLAGNIRAESAACVTFHGGCTAALNAAIHGLAAGCGIGASDRMLASAVEHNAVLRPLAQCQASSRGILEIVPCDRHGRIDSETLIASIRDDVRVVALAHASNVTGALQPLQAVGQAIQTINASRPVERRILFICDAAQTLGYVPVDVQACFMDALAAPAHKGHGGPPGIGLLYVHPRWHDSIVPLFQGGTGNDGLASAMPAHMPARLEPGTLNVPALAGWDAALPSDDASPPVELAALSAHLHTRLREVPGLQVYGCPGPLPIASILFGEKLSPLEAAAVLDGEFGIEVRAGFHCAGKIHDCLGTGRHGTLRISCGHTTQRWHIDALIDALTELNAF